MRMIPLPNPGYFTTWSAVLIGVALVIHAVMPCHSLAAAAVVNSIVVGIAGPAVLAYGNIPGPAPSLFQSNFIYHALPMLVCVAMTGVVRKAPAAEVVGLIALFNVMWFLSGHNGQYAWEKTKTLYGVADPCWVVAIPAMQLGTLYLLRR